MEGHTRRGKGALQEGGGDAVEPTDIQYNAVKVYYPDDAELIRKKVPKDRILSARFAYRDKNVAKRRICPETPAIVRGRSS